MNTKEYDQKKQECWAAFKKQSECEGGCLMADAFFHAFDLAYALGREKETITQEEIEKASVEFADREYKIGQVDWDALYKGYSHGMKDSLGKQEKNVVGEEMLTVPRSKVQEQYALNVNALREGNLTDMQIEIATKVKDILYYLFGSKCADCIPVEVVVAENATTGNVDSLDGNVESLEPKNSRCEKCGAPNSSICAHMNCQDYIPRTEPKPAEPKFKVGEKVMYKGVLRVIDLIDTVTHRYHLANGSYYAEWVDESDLEPYTKPEKEEYERLQAESVETLRIASEESHLRNLSQNIADCDKQLDNILKGSFRNERRLNIAVMAMKGILANSDEVYRAEICSKAKETPKAVAEYALALADTLLAECEKGGFK